MGLGKAIEITYSNLSNKKKQISDMRNYIMERCTKLGRTSVNVSEENRLVYNVSITDTIVLKNKINSLEKSRITTHRYNQSKKYGYRY